MKASDQTPVKTTMNVDVKTNAKRKLFFPSDLLNFKAKKGISDTIK
jgi:hypothetical protein